MNAFSNKRSISEPSPKHQGQDARLNWDLNVQLTEKTTLPQVMIKSFNLCEKKNSYSLGSKGLTMDYLPYNSTV